MHYIVKILVTILISTLMQSSAVEMVSTTPTEAAEDFLGALKAQDPKVMEKYMDNAYVNYIMNAEGDQKVIDRMNAALFGEFSYEIEQVKKRNDVAVAKVTVKSSDFSNVMNEYNKVSYAYVMDNLYDEKIADKKALEKKCMELYVNELEKAAESDSMVETIVFVPMVDDGYYGWNVIMTDELMKSVLGNLQMPIQN